MNWAMFKIWVASCFRCQHFSSDLDQDKILYRMPEYEEQDTWGEYEVWMCSCNCKCGKSGITQRFALSLNEKEIVKGIQINPS